MGAMMGGMGGGAGGGSALQAAMKFMAAPGKGMVDEYRGTQNMPATGSQAQPQQQQQSPFAALTQQTGNQSSAAAPTQTQQSGLPYPEYVYQNGVMTPVQQPKQTSSMIQGK